MEEASQRSLEVDDPGHQGDSTDSRRFLQISSHMGLPSLIPAMMVH